MKNSKKFKGESIEKILFSMMLLFLIVFLGQINTHAQIVFPTNFIGKPNIMLVYADLATYTFRNAHSSQFGPLNCSYDCNSGL
ncbi:MAG: hypothetical protein Q8936_24440 [Bacillota bacterium]|nr:hypothetical protein [Bacillota bacterium]